MHKDTQNYNQQWNEGETKIITFLVGLGDGLSALESSRQGRRQVAPSCKLEGKM